MYFFVNLGQKTLELEALLPPLQLSYIDICQEGFNAFSHSFLLRPPTWTNRNINDSSNDGCGKVFNNDSLP